MTSQTPEVSPDSTDVAISPPPADLDALWQRTQEIAKAPGGPFPNFGAGPLGVYSKQLVGVPFVFLSTPQFRTQNGKFGAQEVAQAYIATFDEKWQLTEKQLATFTGVYLLSRLRNATPRALVGSYVYTVWPNRAFTRVDGQAPLMLKVYEAGDMPPEETDVWTASAPSEAAQTRISEIEANGALPPPWDSGA